MEIGNKYKDVIKVGMEFNNYKAMCEYLGEDTKSGGKGKEYQKSEWNKYFTWDTQGYKRIITEVFDNCKEQVVINKKNAIFKDSISTIILNILLRSEFNPYIKTKNGLMTRIGLTNNNHQEYKNSGSLRAKYANNNNHLYFSVDDFFTRSSGNNRGRLNRVLFDLSERDFITYKNAYILVGKDSVGTDTPRQTTEEEEVIIRDTRRGLLNEMGLDSLADAFKKGKQDAFYKRLNPLINEKFDVVRSYAVISISYNASLVKEYLENCDLVLTDEQLSNEIHQLNDLAVDRIIKLAEKDREKYEHSEYIDDVLYSLVVNDVKEEKKYIEEYGSPVFRAIPDYMNSTLELVALTVKIPDSKIDKLCLDDTDWTSEIFDIPDLSDDVLE